MSKRYPGVRKVAPSRFQVRAEFECPKTGRRRSIVRVVQAAGLQDAASQREDLIKEARNRNTKPERSKLSAFAKSWLTSRLPKLQSATADRYASELDLHILPTFGGWYVDAITREDVIAWRDRQAAKFKPCTVNSHLRTFKLLLRAAKHRYQLDHDATADVEGVPQPDDDDTDDTGKVLTAEELSRLLQAVETTEPQWYPLIRLLAVTGMRWSEATALKWSDIDLDAGHLEIKRKHVRGIIGPPKTRKSRRRLPIEPGTTEVLKAHRADLMRRQAPGLADGWVFPSEVGGLIFNGVACRPLARAAKAAGLGKRPSAHWFRHTLNHLLAQSASERVQMAMLGHVTDRMRLHYDHVFLEEKRAAVVRAFEPLTKPDPSEIRCSSAASKQESQSGGET